MFQALSISTFKLLAGIVKHLLMLNYQIVVLLGIQFKGI